jgi:hypothetical protein
MQLLKKIYIEFFNHNRYKTLSSIFCIILLFIFYGCESKCHSIIDPTKQISLPELQQEINLLCYKAQAEANEIMKQDQLKNFLWTSSIATIQTGQFNWLAFLTGASSLIGAGAITDNVRYRLKFPDRKA